MKTILTCAAILALSPLAATNALAGSSNGLSAALAAGAAAVGAPPTGLGPSDTGQPNQSCEDIPNTPGNSVTAPGSAFNPDGKAGTVYAGEQDQNSKNSASVSQYDVACFRQPSF